MFDTTLLRRHARDSRDIQMIEAYEKYDSIRKAAKNTDFSRGQFERAFARIKRQAVSRGDFEGSLGLSPEGYRVTGQSKIVRGPEGEFEGWLKVEPDPTAFDRERAKEVIAAFKEELPQLPARKAPKQSKNDLLNLFTISDFHLGMLAWKGENGDPDGDWDLQIATEKLIRWVHQGIEMAPKAGKALVCFLGDFFHADGFEPLTPKSKHVLDADSRFPKMAAEGIKLVRYVIEALADHYGSVDVIIAGGNHDPVSSVWLRELTHHVYEKDQRINIDLGCDDYYSYEFGKTGLFFHHGHARRTTNVAPVFVRKFKEVYGRTDFHYGHTGHLHHSKSNEDALMVVDQHATLASKDAYASRGGWLSGRNARIDTYSSKYGKVSQISISSEMLK